MTVLDQLAQLGAQVRTLSDRAAITEVCDLYVHHLDADRHHDAWFGSVFTEDVRLAFPFGEYRGFEGLAAFQRMARTTVERAHHLAGNYAIDLYPEDDVDRARVRAHLMAVHVLRSEDPGTHFDIGGHYEALVVRSPVGWRIRGLDFELVWNAGQSPDAGRW